MRNTPRPLAPPAVSPVCTQKPTCWGKCSESLRRASRVHLLFTGLLFSISLNLAAQTVITRTLDYGSGPNGNTGTYTSQSIVNGNPAIAYYNSTESSLMFARNSAADGSGTWTITTVDHAGTVGQECSLAIVNGNPAISYVDLSMGDLRYVRALNPNGTHWGTSGIVDSVGRVGRFTSLGVVNGNPGISYHDETNGDLKYARALDNNGTNWAPPVTVDTGAAAIVGFSTSMCMVNGYPAISYHDYTNRKLKFVRALDGLGNHWGAPLISDSSFHVGEYCSMAVVDGNPAVSYSDGGSGDLKFVRASDANGTSWGAPLIVDNGGSNTVGAHTSLALVNGNPAISYWDGSNADLRYIRASNASGTAWGTPMTLDSTGLAGYYTSLVVVAGNPAISYFDNTNGNLKYVRASNASGTIWAAPATPDTGVQSGTVGQFTSQAIINGNPAICYYDNSNQDLKYVRALDSGGTNWGEPMTIESTGTVGTYPSLAVVNGNPAISYYDQTNGDLKYVRASNASGATWGVPMNLDSSGIVGSFSSLAVVDGNPAVSYYDQTNGNLKYVRANNSDGSNWGAPATIDSWLNVGRYTSLEMVDGNPAISYYDATNGDLKFVRAATARGTLAGDWGTPMTLDTNGAVGAYTSLAVVDGNPAISYYAGNALGYVRASTASGALATDWSTPLIVDAGGGGVVGQDTSLAVINGNPAISYFNSTTNNLNFVRAATASGALTRDWGTPIVLDSVGQVGPYTSLALVNGNPAISYYDITNGDLKWATVVDATTDAPILTTPAPNSVSGTPVSVAFFLPETGLPGSVNLSFGGNVLTLAASEESAGPHSFSFNPGNPTATAQIASGAPFPDGTYTVTLSYQDALGNPATTASSTGMRLDTTGPAGGTMTLSPASPFDPATVLAVSFADWSDESQPLGYEVYVEDMIVSAAGPSSNRSVIASTTPGYHSLKGRIIDNLGNFTEVTQNFTVNTPQQSFDAAMLVAGLTGNDALPNAIPFNDGVENLLKYAFNMNLAGPDTSKLPPGTGTSGLPSITTPEGAPPGTLRFEFLRRKGSGLVYAPQKSTTLGGTGWAPVAATPVVTAIDDQWERVVYTEAPDPVPATSCFGRVSVSMP